MTLQCDGVNNIGAIMYYMLTINGINYYVIDGMYYTFDTLFDDISI